MRTKISYGHMFKQIISFPSPSPPSPHSHKRRNYLQNSRPYASPMISSTRASALSTPRKKQTGVKTAFRNQKIYTSEQPLIPLSLPPPPISSHVPDLKHCPLDQ